MHTISINIIPVLTLIIPFYGIFLSMFFFVKSQGKLTSNLFMGLFLLALSSLSLRQLIGLMNPVLISFYAGNIDIPPDLLLCPFLFLYTASFIRPDLMHKIHFHLVVILMNLMILLLSGFVQGLLNEFMAATVLVINCSYFIQTLYLFNGHSKGGATVWKYIQISDYSLIAIINLLVFVNIILEVLCPVLWTGFFSTVVQSPKAVLVFYVYYLILQTADFNKGANEPER